MVILLTIKNYLYEIFQQSHVALGVLVVYAVWRHLPVQITSGRLYLYIAATIFGVTTVGRYGRLVLRNATSGQRHASTKVEQVRDAVRVQISVPRPWKVSAGQYVYIWMPGVSASSIVQSHPFMICWWDDDTEGRASHIYLLVKPRSGFTRNLVRHAGSFALSCWVDGPYGKPVSTEDFGSVLMFASGIGIAAQVPYIKGILKDFRNAQTRTKSILLIWQLDNESMCRRPRWLRVMLTMSDDQDWVQDWMTELLDEDKSSYVCEQRRRARFGADTDRLDFEDPPLRDSKLRRRREVVRRHRAVR